MRSAGSYIGAAARQLALAGRFVRLKLSAIRMTGSEQMFYEREARTSDNVTISVIGSLGLASKPSAR